MPLCVGSSRRRSCMQICGALATSEAGGGVPATTALLPVHLRRTLRADGSIQEAISVFCGRKERS
ncbi:MAG TPA: hypothetical protein VFE76_11955, partial [Myxococcales bacterium]|nr:hypothetical protein [Myxococcales bacterium]